MHDRWPKKISKFEFLQEEKYTMFCWIWQLQKTVFENFKKEGSMRFSRLLKTLKAYWKVVQMIRC